MVKCIYSLFQNDTGQVQQLTHAYTTFRKARMLCEIRVDITTAYSYDEIQDAQYAENENLVYAIFTSNRFGFLLCRILQTRFTICSLFFSLGWGHSAQQCVYILQVKIIVN